MKWCWICSNAGIGGEQEHDSDEHQEMMRESFRQMLEMEQAHKNKRIHDEWIKKQPKWNPL